MKDLLALSVRYETPENMDYVELKNKLNRAIEDAFIKVFTENGVSQCGRTFIPEEVIEDIQGYIEEFEEE